jgi:hypothetical protein
VIQDLQGRFPKIYDWDRERGGPQFDPRNAFPAQIVDTPNLFLAQRGRRMMPPADRYFDPWWRDRRFV